MQTQKFVEQNHLDIIMAPYSITTMILYEIDGGIRIEYDGRPARDFEMRAIELMLRLESNGNRRFTLWLVPAKFNCFGLISNPRWLLCNVKMGPKQYNRDVNVVFDENCTSNSECVLHDAVPIKACRHKDGREDRFLNYENFNEFWESALST